MKTVNRKEKEENVKRSSWEKVNDNKEKQIREEIVRGK